MIRRWRQIIFSEFEAVPEASTQLDILPEATPCSARKQNYRPIRRRYPPDQVWRRRDPEETPPP